MSRICLNGIKSSLREEFDWVEVFLKQSMSSFRFVFIYFLARMHYEHAKKLTGHVILMQ